MASMSVSGVVSGMDWESMINEIIESASKPAQVQVNKRTNLTNKKSLFEEMKVTMNSIQTSLTPLKLPSTYKAKEIEIERIDKSGSYKGVLTATVNADAEVNVYDLEVNQLARAQSNRSKQITSSNLKSTLTGIESSKMYINAGGQEIGIDVYNTDTLESLKSRINTTLKTLSTPVNITASVVDSRLILKSDSTGLGKNSVTGTTSQKYDSSGVTSLNTIITNADSGAATNLIIDESNLDNLKVMSGSSSYVIHEDYEIVNNEIRWKQYNDTKEVKLGESVTAVYKMGAGDVFSKTVTKSSDDTEEVSFGFNLIDNGTLSQRMKIQGNKTTSTTSTTKKYSLDSDEKTGTTTSTETITEDGKEVKVKTTKTITFVEDDSGDYYNVETTVAKTKVTDFIYGKDFTYTDGTITWLEQAATTNEPESYTVSFEKNNSFTYEVNGTNSAKYVDVNKEPDTYTAKITIGSETLYAKVNKTDNDKTLNAIFGREIDSSYYTNLEIRGYEYGTNSDFIVNDDGEIEWVTKSQYSGSADDDEADFDIDEFNKAYKQATGEEISTLTLTGSDGVIRTYLDPEDRSLFKLTSNDDGTEYEYGRDYVIRVNDSGDGYVFSWFAANDTNLDDVIDAKDANIAVSTYAKAKEKNISTLNFKTAPEAGPGYVFSFDIEDKSKYSASVTASDDDKDLSLESLFGDDVELSEGDYSSIVITDEDGTEYKYGTDFTITDGEIVWLPKTETVTTTTTEEVEVTTTHKPESFTLNYTKSGTELEKVISMDMTMGSSSTDFEVTGLFTDGTIKALPFLDNLYYDETGEYLDTYDYTNNTNIKIVDHFDKDNPIILDINGTEYEYGKDFLLRTGASDTNPRLFINFVRTTPASSGTSYYQDYKNYLITQGYTAADLASTNVAPALGTSFEFQIYKKNDIDIDETYDSTNDDDSVLSEIIAAAEGDYENLTLTGSDGTIYYYVDDVNDLDENTFTIVDGKIKWYETTSTETVTTTKTETKPLEIYAPNAPDEDSEYTIFYESFKPIEAKGTYDYEDFEVKLLYDGGKISASSNSYLSYEQILKDANPKLTTSSSQSDIDSALAKYFTLTDEEGETYTYGTDYRISMGDEDSGSEQHKVILEWIGANAPAYNDKFTLSYTGKGEGGGEVFEIENAVTRSNSDDVIAGYGNTISFSEFQNGTTTITQGSRTFYEGIDFEIDGDEETDGSVTVNWKTGTKYEWYYPSSGSQYTINLTTEDGTQKTFTAARSSGETLDLRNLGFSTVSNNGNLISIDYGGKTYDLTSARTDENGKTDSDLVKETLGINLNEGTNGGVKVYNFDWVTPVLTSRDNLPSYGDDIEIDYSYNNNTFTLSDDGDGLIDLLGLNDDVTEAQNAVMILDGEEIERDSNDIGESYGNELIKGMTINLKGIGEVSMDVAHDAEKAIESIQTFVDNYNSLMSWMNTRMTESQVDEDTAATIDSDDFRMRWGLLHGNSLLRNTKSQMRDITAQNFTYSFTERKSSEEVYGTMSYNGLKNNATLRLRINSTYVDVSILTTDTIEDIANKINDSSDPAMRNIFYGDDGNLLTDPLIKAKVEGDKLVISSSSNSEITMSGSAAMNALKMNYTYKGVYQLGIATTSTDYGKSGELEFDTEKFMEALEDNPDETQELMLKYASAMDTWTKSMLNTSASGETSGTLTRQISDLDSQIKSIDEYLEKYQERLDRMEESLRTKYNAAEQQIAKLSQQASAISGILQQLSGNSSNNNNSNS